MAASSSVKIGSSWFHTIGLLAAMLQATGPAVSASGPYHSAPRGTLYAEWPEGHEVQCYEMGETCDDGTEAANAWYPDGYVSNLNCLGRYCDNTFAVGLRFRVCGLEQGQTVEYARLRVAVQGGELASQAALLIKGVDEDSPEPLSDERKPSDLPKVAQMVEWEIGRVWPSTGTSLGLYRNSPDVAVIINSILASPNWGQGAEGKVLILTVEDAGSPQGETNYLRFEDFSTDPACRDPAILEIYPTLAAAFVGKPMLGRPTDESVTVNMINLLDIDVYAEYGLTPGVFPFSTAHLLGQPAQQPIEIIIDGLQPDQRYYYRVRYREPGSGEYLEGAQASFNTQRSPASAFVFTVQADAQHLDCYRHKDRYARNCSLYKHTLCNVAADNPDFHIDMGDFASTELRYRDAADQEEATERYLMQRAYLDRLTHSTPFYLVLGNHEGEQGWRGGNEEDSLEVWSTRARKKVIPNPVPNTFYSGNEDSTDCCGLREDYYAWVWGDALFVVLDPFWYTMTKPHFYHDDGYPPSNDGWDWTLGRDQYNWLYDTLHGTTARWKFVFCHHLTGGVLSGLPVPTPYGRGGIEAAKHKVDGRPSFEWGGEKANGTYVFGNKRPGWSHGAIHDMMASEGATIMFHGHDHVFVHQTLDGIEYQTCPQPHDSEYSDGFYAESCYSNGIARNNSGHLRVGVADDMVQVEYVRSVLPGDEPLFEEGNSVYNGYVSHSYTISLSGLPTEVNGLTKSALLSCRPNPFDSMTRLAFRLPRRTEVRIDIFDVLGRRVHTLLDEPLDEGAYDLPWKAHSQSNEPLSPGVYWCRLQTGPDCATQKIVLLK